MSLGGILRLRAAAAFVVLGGALAGSSPARAEEPKVAAVGAPEAEELASSEPTAEDGTSHVIADLARRAARLAQREGLVPEVLGPLSGVTHALEAMRQAWARGDLAAASRAEGVARAGLLLAERRYSLSLEQALMRAAIARRDAARSHVQTSAAAREAEGRRRAAQVPTAASPTTESRP